MMVTGGGESLMQMDDSRRRSHEVKVTDIEHFD